MFLGPQPVEYKKYYILIPAISFNPSNCGHIEGMLEKYVDPFRIHNLKALRTQDLNLILSNTNLGCHLH